MISRRRNDDFRLFAAVADPFAKSPDGPSAVQRSFVGAKRNSVRSFVPIFRLFRPYAVRSRTQSDNPLTISFLFSYSSSFYANDEKNNSRASCWKVDAASKKKRKTVSRRPGRKRSAFLLIDVRRRRSVVDRTPEPAEWLSASGPSRRFNYDADNLNDFVFTTGLGCRTKTEGRAWK